jgi:hypothetical protein
MASSKSSRKTNTNFSLKISSSLKDVHSKYELVFPERNITNIENNENCVESLSYLDESKRIHKCMLSKLDFSNPSGYCCYWCRNIFTSEPIGCPLKYIPNVISRVFFSEITKEKFIVKEGTTKSKINTPGIEATVEQNNYYETDGIFCSFECCMSYINENKKNPLYIESEILLNKIYSDCGYKGKIKHAPHWRILKEYGGSLTIAQFRANFNHIEYEAHGIYKPQFKSINHAYEEKIKF